MLMRGRAFNNQHYGNEYDAEERGESILRSLPVGSQHPPVMVFLEALGPGVLPAPRASVKQVRNFLRRHECTERVCINATMRTNCDYVLCYLCLVCLITLCQCDVGSVP